MATLYVDRRGAFLEADGRRLQLKVEGEPARSVPLALLERVVATAGATIAGSALVALGEAGVPLLVLGARHQERVAFVLGRLHRDLAVRVAQVERAADPAWSLEWSRSLVRRKIARQVRWLERAGQRAPRARKRIAGALRTLGRCHGSLRGCDSLDALRGLEGTAARAEFQALAALVPPSLDFSGRNRRPPKDPVNAALSLAYTLAHFEAVRAAYAHGFDPYVGFYHRPAFGRASFACDLVEPWRPAVNEWTWRLFAERILRREHFVKDRGRCLLGKAARERFYSEYERFAGALRRGLHRTCRVLARGLRARVRLRIEDACDDEGVDG